jgi:protein SCO1/2
MDIPLQKPKPSPLPNYLLAAALLFLFGVIVWLFVLRPKPLHGFPLADPIAVPNFTLTAHDGQRVSLFDLRDKVVLLAYGYTSCPDVCPITLAVLTNARDQLPARLRDDVQVVFISVDPERDADKLAAYMGHFDRDHLGLTGTEDELVLATAPLGVRWEKVTVEDREDYFVDHTATVAVLDKQGQLRTVYPFGMGVNEIAPDLRRLAREK